MQVHELMSTEVVTVGGDATLADAADRLLEAGVGSVLVVEGGGAARIGPQTGLLRGARGTGKAPRDLRAGRPGPGGHGPTTPRRPSPPSPQPAGPPPAAAGGPQHGRAGPPSSRGPARDGTRAPLAAHHQRRGR